MEVMMKRDGARSSMTRRGVLPICAGKWAIPAQKSSFAGMVLFALLVGLGLVAVDLRDVVGRTRERVRD
jgi:hypothetical protein